MSKRLQALSVVFATVLVVGCVPLAPGDGNDGAETLSFEFDFQDGTADGWRAELTDFPPDQEGNLQFMAEVRSLPPELETSGTGLYVQSFNTPDDLFTFIKRKLTAEDGVVANQAYRVGYEIHFASNAPTGCFGVGGSPGESVYLKAGAAGTEPLPVLSADGQRFELNVDKGDQESSGIAASVVSDIANGIPCEDVPDLQMAPYAALVRDHNQHEPVTASETGELWLLIGVDSGFESLTGLYYQRIDVTLEPVD